jgi:predicted metal-dependent phosphoesterase TrpH
MRIDLHVHSDRSPDSNLSLDQIVQQLSGTSLQGFALTDHNTIAGHPRLRELASENRSYRMIPGVEVSTREGHLLVYGVAELPPIHAPLSETLDWVHARSGVAVLAHPFRWAHGVGRRVAETANVDGIETVNGHNPPVANARAELVAARRHLTVTGGSDAHDRDGLGRACTEFPSDVDTVDEMLTALRRSRTSASGRSLGFAERIRLSARTGALRALRGFRPV